MRNFASWPGYVLPLSMFLGPGLSQAKEQVRFYTHQLESLSTFGSLDTSSLYGRSSLWILFQPSCGSCKVQFQQLDCLSKEVQQVALGIGGTREQLQRTLQPTNFKGIKVLASPQLQTLLATRATPTLYIVDKTGRLEKVIQGVTPCPRLKSEFALLR